MSNYGGGPQLAVDAGEIQIEFSGVESPHPPYGEEDDSPDGHLDDLSDMSTDQTGLFKIEDVLRPTGKQVQKGMKYFDLAVKIEKLLYELHSFLYWGSLIEVFTLLVAILMFLKFSDQLGVNMMFMPHLPRALIGFKLDSSIPRSHNIINQMSFDEETMPGGKITFDAVQESAKNSVIIIFGQMFTDVQVNIRLYFFVSMLCVILDYTVVFYALNRFGVAGEEDAEMILIGLCIPFLFVNLFWGSYVLFLKLHLPSYIAVFVMDAIKGVAVNIREKTKQTIKKKVKQAPRKVYMGGVRLKQKIAERRTKRIQKKQQKNSARAVRSQTRAGLSPVIPGKGELPEYEIEAPSYKQSKEEVQGRPCDLQSIVEVYQMATDCLREIRGEDVVVVLGPTGCGKSTLLSAINFGSDTLQSQQMGNKVVIDSIEEQEEFKIGHEPGKPMTFLPEFQVEVFRDFETGLERQIIFVDIAGLHDANVDLVEIVNSFITKTIFQEAKSVQFILAIPFQDLTSNRSSTVKDTMKIIQTICDGQQLYSLTDSLRPVITQYPATGDKDIAEVRSEIEDQLLYSLEQEREAMEKQFVRDSQEHREFQKYYNDLQKFYTFIAHEFEIVDPLDRELQTESIQVEELKQKILESSGISGSLLSAPLSRKATQTVEQVIDKDFEMCSRIAKVYIQKAKDLGVSFDHLLCNEKNIRVFRARVNFLAENNLYPWAKYVLEQARHWTDENQVLIDEAKRYQEYTKEQQELFDAIESLLNLKMTSDFALLAQKMFQLLDLNQKGFKGGASIDEQMNVELLRNKSRRTVEDIVAYVGHRPEHLYEFAYELRKADHNDLYSQNILLGNVKPTILAKILLSNKWNGQEMCSTQDFKLGIGTGCSLKFDTTDAALPFVGPDQFTSKIKFLLNRKGIVIRNSASEVSPGGDLPAVARYLWAQADEPLPDGESCDLQWRPLEGAGQERMTWHLISSDPLTDFPTFTIEQDGLNRKSRLIVTQSKPKSRSTIKMTTRDVDGYHDDGRSSWTVFQVD